MSRVYYIEQIVNFTNVSISIEDERREEFFNMISPPIKFDDDTLIFHGKEESDVLCVNIYYGLQYSGNRFNTFKSKYELNSWDFHKYVKNEIETKYGFKCFE